MRWCLACIILVGLAVGCSRIFKTKREQPPDVWSLKAAAMHAMVTAPPAFTAAKPDCTAAPMPDLQLFCEKKCDSIGELSLKAYCAWDCGEVKNPDLGVMCKLEVKTRENATVRPEDCDAINASDLKEHCTQWIASLPKPKPKPKQQ